MDVLRRGEDVLSELGGTRQNVLFFHTMHVRNLEQRRLLIDTGCDRYRAQCFLSTAEYDARGMDMANAVPRPKFLEGIQITLTDNDLSIGEI